MRGASALRGSCVIAAATLLGRGVTAAWEGHLRGVGEASLLHGWGVRGVTTAWYYDGMGVGGVSLRRERGISTALEQRHRCSYAAWEVCHSWVGGAWKGITAA